MHKLHIGWLVVALLLLAGLVGCSEQNGAGIANMPRDLTREEVCMIDGMILLDYPGPKGQLFFKDGEARFFCDTKGLITTLFDPDYKNKIKIAYVQDFGGREWGSYNDRWVDVGQAFLVLDSNKFGAMGPTIVTFGARADADAFVAQNGGNVLTLAELDEVRLDDYLKRVRQQLRELTDLSTISGDSDVAGEGQRQGVHSHD
jgi:copper chaperone NosL